MSRRRGIALADFMCGIMIFSAALSAFVALTRSKFNALESTAFSARALASVEERLDRLRLEGLQRAPEGDVDPQGFMPVEEFAGPEGLLAGHGRVDARTLRVESGELHALYEVRVSVSWESIPGQPNSRAVVSLSTVSPLPEERR